MNIQEIMREVRSLVEEMGIEVCSDEDNLVDDLGMDSTEIADLATSIAKKYKVDIDNCEYKKSNIAEIVKMIYQVA